MDVSILDVPGEYINADITKENIILLKTEVKFVDIVWEVNP